MPLPTVVLQSVEREKVPVLGAQALGRWKIAVVAAAVAAAAIGKGNGGEAEGTD